MAEWCAVYFLNLIFYCSIPRPIPMKTRCSLGLGPLVPAPPMRPMYFEAKIMRISYTVRGKKCFPPAVTLLSSLAGHFFKSQIEALVSLFRMDRSTRRSVYFVYTIVVLTIDMFMSIWTFSALECKSMECAVQQNKTLSLLELLTHLSYPFLVQNETSTLFKEALCEPYEFFVFQNIKNI